MESFNARFSTDDRQAGFRTFADTMPCIVLAATADGSMTHLNARWFETTGAVRSGAPDQWLEKVHPDDQEGVRGVWTSLIAAGKPFEVELRLWSENLREHRWHLLRMRPRAEDTGAIAGWAGTCEDIHNRQLAESRLRESEARLKTLIDSSPVGVVVLNPQGQPVYFNKKCAELRAQEVDFSAWANAVHPEDRDRVVASSIRAVQDAKAWSATFRFVHPSGRIVWVSGRTVPVWSGPALIGFVRTLEDITELKVTADTLRGTNEELRRQQEKLELEVQVRTANEREALSELDKLSYSIVHDMRAPLRALSGFSRMLLEEHSHSINETARDYLRRIAAAAGRQDKLIQDILVYHRCVRQPVTLEPVKLDDLIALILQTYPKFQPPAVEVEIRKPLGEVLAHEALLTQAISALVDNAIKFVAAGVKPRIVIRSERRGNQVRLAIEDNGIGIAPETMVSLFDIFYKIHHARDYPGTGIGLPLAKKAVERMKGTIGAESTPGKGSRFWISLTAVP